jgi:upstream activation factor subunit UAF30
MRKEDSEKHNVSPDLEAVIGKGPMTSREACDRLWGYMGKKEPKDTAHRDSFMADEKLKKIFGGREEITQDELEDIISPHLS